MTPAKNIFPSRCILEGRCAISNGDVGGHAIPGIGYCRRVFDSLHQHFYVDDQSKTPSRIAEGTGVLLVDTSEVCFHQ